MTEPETPQTAPVEPQPNTLMERVAAVEKEVSAMQAALRRAFGERWMDERSKARE